MVQNSNETVSDPSADLETLEAELQQSEPAEAPEKAEEIARLLGARLDNVDRGAGSVTP